MYWGESYESFHTEAQVPTFDYLREGMEIWQKNMIFSIRKSA